MVVGFKTTTQKTIREQFKASQRQIDAAKVTFVLANDVDTRMNLIIQADVDGSCKIIGASTNREGILNLLADQVTAALKKRASNPKGPTNG